MIRITCEPCTTLLKAASCSLIKLQFDDGFIKVPDGPGLGVELDQDALKEFHKFYLAQHPRDREDTDEMRKYIPD